VDDLLNTEIRIRWTRIHNSHVEAQLENVVNEVREIMAESQGKGIDRGAVTIVMERRRR